MHNRDLELLATPEEEEAFRIGYSVFLCRIAGYLTPDNRLIFSNLVVNCLPEVSSLRAAITAQAALPIASPLNVATPFLTTKRVSSDLFNNVVDAALVSLVRDPDNPAILKTYAEMQRALPVNKYEEIILSRLERCLTDVNRDVFYEILHRIRHDAPLGPSLGGRRRRKSRKSRKSRKTRKSRK